MMFLGMGLTWLLSIGVILLTIGLAANAVWRAVFAPLGLPKGASCGSCGYELATLEAGRCSECGADLLLAGVMTRRNALRLSGSLPAAIIGWSIICVTIGTVAMGVVSWISMMSTFGGGGGSTPITSEYTFEPEPSFDEDTGTFGPSADYAITMTSDVVTGPNMMSTQSGTIRVTLEHADAETAFTIDAGTGAWVWADDAGAEIASESSFTAEDAKEVYAEVGLDTGASPALEHEAAQLTQLVDGAMSDPWNYQYNTLGFNAADPDAPGGLTHTGGTMNTGLTGMGGSAGEVIGVLSILGVSVLVWTLGLVLIVRRRARVIRGPRPAAA